MSRLKFGILCLFLFASSYAFSSVEPQSDDVKLAQTKVDSYRDLRRECASSERSQRRDCFSQLSAMTQSYKAAKQMLVGAGSASGAPMLGQMSR